MSNVNELKVRATSGQRFALAWMMHAACRTGERDAVTRLHIEPDYPHHAYAEEIFEHVAEDQYEEYGETMMYWREWFFMLFDEISQVVDDILEGKEEDLDPVYSDQTRKEIEQALLKTERVADFKGFGTFEYWGYSYFKSKE